MTKHSPKEQTSSQDKKLIYSIQSGLDILDQHSEIDSPPLVFFETIVEQKKEQERSKLIKDLTVFFLVAIVVLTILMSSIINIPIIFIMIQVISIIIMPFYLLIVYRRRQVDVHDA